LHLFSTPRCLFDHHWEHIDLKPFKKLEFSADFFAIRIEAGDLFFGLMIA